MRSRTRRGMSTYVSVVISPATTTRPVVISVSQATRPEGSSLSTASRTESEIWSAILSGWPSVTDSDVKEKERLGIAVSLSGEELRSSPELEELCQRESAVSRWLRAGGTLGWWGSSATFVAGEQAARARPLLRGVVTRRYAAALAPRGFETSQPKKAPRPEAKTPRSGASPQAGPRARRPPPRASA